MCHLDVLLEQDARAGIIPVAFDAGKGDNATGGFTGGMTAHVAIKVESFRPGVKQRTLGETEGIVSVLGTAVEASQICSRGRRFRRRRAVLDGAVAETVEIVGAEALGAELGLRSLLLWPAGGGKLRQLSQHLGFLLGLIVSEGFLQHNCGRRAQQCEEGKQQE